MKLQHLIEMALPKAPEVKKNRLMKLLTPENIKQHYALVIDLIGANMSNTLLDELEATLKGTLRDADDTGFSLQLMLKELGKHTKVRLDKGQPGTRQDYDQIVGTVPTPPKSHDLFSFTVAFHNARWKLWWSNGQVTRTKKFEKEEDCLKHALKVVEAMKRGELKQ